MNTTPIGNHLRVALKHSALALAVAAGIVAGSAEAGTTTATYNLGTQASPTTIQKGIAGLLPWKAKGVLPTGSILKSVSIDAIIENFGTDGINDDWALDICVYIDPSPQAAGTAALLQVGGYDNIGIVTKKINWPNGDGGPRRPVTGTKTAADWSSLGDIDLSTVQLSVGNDWSQAAWSGTITVTYDTPEPATIRSFGTNVVGSSAIIAVPVAGMATINWTVPYASGSTPALLAALAPQFTLSSGTCTNQTSGVAPVSPNFSASPVTYTVADGATVNNYAVTVTVSPASTACDILTFGLPENPGVIDQVARTITLNVPVSPGVTSLAPTYTVSQFASGLPLSGTTRNFTSPQTYTVTAQNGTTQKTYTVTVQTYQTWTYSGSFFILTTPDGANIATGSAESNFPLLVRLNSNIFPFAQAASDGRDIRFATATGTALSYQIEQWDSVNGQAAVWVKIPSIAANARQEIKMYWGKTGVTSASNGAAVFSAANGYASVLHLNESLTDVLGNTAPTNNGTTVGAGLIGKGRQFVAGQGVDCGQNITTLPAGGASHSTSLWVKSDSASWASLVRWGKAQDNGQVELELSPAPTTRATMNGYYSDATIRGTTAVTRGQWTHLAYTYNNSAGKLYVNGVLDSTASGALSLPSPAVMFLGRGWQGSYTFAGDMDEVRISQAARSANWVKLEYENQKALQTLVGNLVQPGTTFAVTPTSANFLEGTTTTLTGQAGGAQKVYWIEKRNGVDTVLATDTFSLPVTAGRVTGSQSYIIQFKAIYPSPAPNQTVDIPITITEDLPDPVFTLTGPSTWDGRQSITVSANISNLATLQAKNVANSTYKWSVTGVAATKTINAATPTVPGSLTFTRSQGDGPMTVTLVLSNGGSPVTASKTITVQQPATPDAWVQRTPVANEKPAAKQFFARDPNTNNGTIFYNGTGAGTTPVYLKVFAKPNGETEAQYGVTHRLTPVAGAYAFAVPIAAGLVTYKVEFGTTTGSTDTPTHTVTDLVCGDAYLIEGQSNALATDNAVPADTNTSPWIRSYGSTLGWGYATNKDSDAELQLGVWGWIWAKRLSATYNMPICIINGAVGGTRIDVHLPNPANHYDMTGDGYTAGSVRNYGQMMTRVANAKLTHGIRAVLWHQGEQDQGTEGPDGDYDYKFYQQYFVDLSSAWKQDFPNIQKYYIFQIWPAACGSMSNGSDDKLREKQRTLPYLYSNMRIMSTLGIVPGSGCHYVLEGYQKFSDLISPLVEQDFYGLSPGAVFSAPNLKKAYYSTTARTEISLEFDQDIGLDATAGRYYLDGLAGKVSTVSHSGKVVKLTLTAASTAKAITYVQGTTWDGIQTTLLYGSNGIAALTFADVPLTPPAPSGLGATPGVSQVALTWAAAAGATGYNVKRSSTSGGPYTVIGTTAGTTSYTDSTATHGTTYYYVVSANNTAGESSDSNQASATPNTPYGAWAANPAQGLTAGVNDGPMDDPDHDGIPNLLEFVLGGAPMVSSQTILPKLTRSGGSWFYEYDRSDLSLPPAATQVVEYGSDLTGWAAVTIPATSSGSVTITPGSPSDHVKVAIPTPGARTFARLKITQPYPWTAAWSTGATLWKP